MDALDAEIGSFHTDLSDDSTSVSFPPDVQYHVDGSMENHRYIFDFDDGSMY